MSYIRFQIIFLINMWLNYHVFLQNLGEMCEKLLFDHFEKFDTYASNPKDFIPIWAFGPNKNNIFKKNKWTCIIGLRLVIVYALY